MTKNLINMMSACAMLSLAACSSGGSGDSARTADRDGREPAGSLSRGSSSRVDKAVTVARAVEANPGRADEVLREHGLTTEQYEDLMYDIAADPDMSAEFEARMGG